MEILGVQTKQSKVFLKEDRHPIDYYRESKQMQNQNKW